MLSCIGSPATHASYVAPNGPDRWGSPSAYVLVTDFYSVYTSHDEWTHAYCAAHMVREAKKVAECCPCARTEEFRDQVCAWYASVDS